MVIQDVFSLQQMFEQTDEGFDLSQLPSRRSIDTAAFLEQASSSSPGLRRSIQILQVTRKLLQVRITTPWQACSPSFRSEQATIDDIKAFRWLHRTRKAEIDVHR